MWTEWRLPPISHNQKCGVPHKPPAVLGRSLGNSAHGLGSKLWPSSFPPQSSMLPKLGKIACRENEPHQSRVRKQPISVGGCSAHHFAAAQSPKIFRCRDNPFFPHQSSVLFCCCTTGQFTQSKPGAVVVSVFFQPTNDGRSLYNDENGNSRRKWPWKCGGWKMN